MNNPHVQPVRGASRLMVRELGMLSDSSACNGITNSQCHSLIELESSGALGVNQLSARLNLDRSTVSRIVTSLLKAKLVELASTSDKRSKPVRLSKLGAKRLAEIHHTSNNRVESALKLLKPDLQRQVVEGMQHYATALRRARLRETLCVREIKRTDNQVMAKVILDVLRSFVGDRPGFANRDAEISDMYNAYRTKGSRFFVATVEGQVVGGAGIAPLAGDSGKVCELRKMYLLPEYQGLGIGRDLIESCLAFARQSGYGKCYLETLRSMGSANALYDGFGFKDLQTPLGCTGHHGCDRWRCLEL